jgi:hypothetical protein
MNAKSLIKSSLLVVLAAWMCGMPVAAQEGQSLGTVRLPRAVMANGQSLPAGTYTARLSTDAVPPVVGQSAGAAQWVEFLQTGQVRGRELASVVSPPDVKEVAKGTPPAPGTARVQALRGADYLRVWLNRAGTQYLIHFNVAK